MQGSASEINNKYKYANVLDAIMKIVKEEGALGLYANVDATVLRASVLAATELGSYDILKTYAVSRFGFEATQ